MVFKLIPTLSRPFCNTLQDPLRQQVFVIVQFCEAHENEVFDQLNSIGCVDRSRELHSGLFEPYIDEFFKLGPSFQ